MTKIYCVKCKVKRQISEVEEFVNKRGLRAASGVCPVCMKNVCTILGK